MAALCLLFLLSLAVVVFVESRLGMTIRTEIFMYFRQGGSCLSLFVFLTTCPALRLTWALTLLLIDVDREAYHV